MTLYASRDQILKGYRAIWAGLEFDMSIPFDRQTSLMGSFRTGTRTFQSINALSGGEFGLYAWPHDYLDDLESLFYCLARICCTYTEPGKVREVPKELVAWEDPNLMHAANAKRSFLGIVKYLLTPYFECLHNMFRSMGTFLSQHASRKDDASRAQRKRGEEMKVHLKDMMDESTGHYDTFLGFIDQSIKILSPSIDIVNPELITPPAQPLNEYFPHNHIPDDDPIEPSGKRQPDEVEDCLSTPKRVVSQLLARPSIDHDP